MPLPADKFRWTVDRYQYAVETGFLASNARFELIDGELIAVVPPNPPHARLVRGLNRLFSTSPLANTFVVCVQDPIALSPESHPEPDLCIVRGPEARYVNRHPGSADVLLVIGY